jgi:hypothetical protein
VLVHGTFCGNDVLGLWTELARIAPGLSNQCRRVTKAGMDLLIGEAGNYTRRFAERMQTGLSAGAGRTIPVRLFNWSSQNTHIARADGAVRLIDELTTLANELNSVGTNAAGPPRILVWSHSHGGNALALLTNLLGGDIATRREFFHATRSFFHRWRSSRVDFPVWQRVEDLLAGASRPLQNAALDLVTFGTPIRYGWDLGGCSQLLHIYNHRPAHADRAWLTSMPPHWRRVLWGGDGDFVAQFGIAGSGFPANPLAFRTLTANRRLRRLVSDGVPWWLLKNMRPGMRVPADGRSLLIDYAEPGRMPLQHVFGHVLYTRSRWLPLHCELMAEELYGGADAPFGMNSHALEA